VLLAMTLSAMALQIAFLIACVPLASVQPCPESSQQVLEQVTAGYERKTSPAEYAHKLAPGPTTLHASYFILGVMDVDMKSQTVTVAVGMTLHWVDLRLLWNSSCFAFEFVELLNESEIVEFMESPESYIWVPKVIVNNWRETPKTIDRHWYLTPSGVVIIRERQFWTLSCDMDFTKMPYDEQVCPARLTSSHLSYILTIQAWLGVGTREGERNPGGSLEWQLQESQPFEHTNRVADETGVVPIHKLHFRIKRNPNFIEKTVIQPVVFLVFFTYFAFWIPRNAVPARVSLVATCYLAISNKRSSVSDNMPPVPGSVWLDTFMSISSFFVFIAGVEYGFVMYLSSIEVRVAQARDAVSADAVEDADPELPMKYRMRSSLGLFEYLLLDKDGQQRLKALHVEVAMRFLFPVTYSMAVGAKYASLL